jgi:hypothetical protein
MLYSYHLGFRLTLGGQAMALICTWTEAPDHLAVRMEGPYALDAFKRAVDEILTEAQRRGRRCVLIDTTPMAIEDFPMFDRYEIGRYAAETWSYHLKAALLALPQHINRFAETVALNRGANLHVFTNEPEALAWLLNKPAPPGPGA